MTRLTCFLVACSVVFSVTPASAQIKEFGDFLYSPVRQNRSVILTPPLDGELSLGWKCGPVQLYDTIPLRLASFPIGIVPFIIGLNYDGDDDKILVQYRIDNTPASGNQWWPLLHGKRQAYMPMPTVEQFTRAAMAGTSMFLRATDPLSGEQDEGEFSLNGLTDALKQLPCAAHLFSQSQR